MNIKPYTKPLFALLGSLVAMASAQADTLYFKNGDQLTGTLLSMQDGVIEFDTSIAGKISIPMDQLRSFTTQESAELHLADGSVLKQPVTASDNEAITLAETGVLSTQTLPLDTLTQINPAPEKLPEWTGKLTAGLTLERGNTSRNDSHIDIDLVKETVQDRIRIDAEYDENREQDQETGDRITSKRRYVLGGSYDYFFSDKVYVYGNTKAEKEATANIDLRLNIGTGAGYRWFNTPITKLDTEVGLSWVNESFSDDTSDESYLALRFAWDYNYQLNDSTAFFHNAEWFPSLENAEDQLVDSETGIRTQINHHLSLEAKIKHRWDQTPADDNDKQDVSYIFGVGWTF